MLQMPDIIKLWETAWQHTTGKHRGKMIYPTLLNIKSLIQKHADLWGGGQLKALLTTVSSPLGRRIFISFQHSLQSPVLLSIHTVDLASTSLLRRGWQSFPCTVGSVFCLGFRTVSQFWSELHLQRSPGLCDCSFRYLPQGLVLCLPACRLRMFTMVSEVNVSFIQHGEPVLHSLGNNAAFTRNYPLPRGKSISCFCKQMFNPPQPNELKQRAVNSYTEGRICLSSCRQKVRHPWVSFIMTASEG